MSDPAPLPPRFATYIAALRDAGEHPSLRTYPGLPSQPWYDPNAFPIVAELEANAARIAAEFRRIDAHAFVPEREPVVRSGAWEVFMLYERGRRRDDRLALVPALGEILERHRTVRTLAGLVYFSRLAPHTRVAPHRGPTNMRVRIHLGIDVPPHCGIRVGDVTDTWREGACIAFDDSYEHEVWNEAERERIVLVADQWHPDLSADEVRLLDGFGRYVGYAAENLERYWAANGA